MRHFRKLTLPAMPHSKEGFICTLTMLLGLLSPAIIALITVFGSKSKELKADFKRKIFRFYKLRPKYIFAAVIIVFTNKDLFFEKRHIGRILES